MRDRNISKVEKLKTNLFWYCVDILSCKLEIIAKFYERTVGREYIKESNRFNLSKSKNILHIGCGPYPISAMTFAKLNGVKAVTIDTNQKSIKLANKILDKEGFNGRIKANIGNGANYPLDSFDTIIISSCSIPKNEVIEHVLKDSKPKSRIIIRESFSSVKALIEKINTHKDIKIIDEIIARPFPSSKWKSFYLYKEKNLKKINSEFLN